jgi:hypothetical protein
MDANFREMIISDHSVFNPKIFEMIRIFLIPLAFIRVHSRLKFYFAQASRIAWIAAAMSLAPKVVEPATMTLAPAW